jgi:hypothetical protein
MALVELSYDEIETLLISLILRQDEILSIPKGEESDMTKYEMEYIFDLSDRLNEIQRDLEEKMGRELERLANNGGTQRKSVVERVMGFLGLDKTY